jgi:carboxypeptidase C (cathepsin A)
MLSSPRRAQERHRMNTFSKAAVLFLLAAASATLAQPASSSSTDDKPKERAAPAPSTTEHSVMIGGRSIEYTATAGTIELPDYEGKPKANVFYIAYTAKQPPDSPPRPITYAFNGGPGSSSVWLHLGALGPKRVTFADPAEQHGTPALPAPPYSVIDNEFSWLDLTDLVFIDPVGTGYSRPVEGEKKEQFHGLTEDIQWVGDFIRLWTTRNQRWDSAKFLAGESYGTTRAAGLAGTLQDTHGMYISGIVLISPVLNFQTIRFDEGNDTPFWLYLPTYTATAWYHGKLSEALQKDLDAALKESELFAQNDYLLALGRGDALSGEERADIASELARLTGLSQDFVLRSNLRINISQFTKELLRDKGRTVGRLDSRYTGIDRSGVTASPEYDPSYAAIQGPFTAALNHYIRAELKYENDDPYEILTGRVQPWSFASASNQYADVSGTLRSAMTKNRSLRVLVASGFYDLATPHFAAAYTIRHMGLDPEVRPNITQTFYRAGHMMYIRHEDLSGLKADAARFYTPPSHP